MKTNFTSVILEGLHPERQQNLAEEVAEDGLLEKLLGNEPYPNDLPETIEVNAEEVPMER